MKLITAEQANRKLGNMLVTIATLRQMVREEPNIRIERGVSDLRREVDRLRGRFTNYSGVTVTMFGADHRAVRREFRTPREAAAFLEKLGAADRGPRYAVRVTRADDSTFWAREATTRVVPARILQEATTGDCWGTLRGLEARALAEYPYPQCHVEIVDVTEEY